MFNILMITIALVAVIGYIDSTNSTVNYFKRHLWLIPLIMMGLALIYTGYLTLSLYSSMTNELAVEFDEAYEVLASFGFNFISIIFFVIVYVIQIIFTWIGYGVGYAIAKVMVNSKQKDANLMDYNNQYDDQYAQYDDSSFEYYNDTNNDYDSESL